MLAVSDKEFCTDFAKHVSEEHPKLHEEIKANGGELPTSEFHNADILRITEYVSVKLEALAGDLRAENHINIGNMPDTVHETFILISTGRSNISSACLKHLIPSLKEKHRDIYHQPWDGSKSVETVHNFCIEMIAYASDPAGVALHEVQQIIFSEKKKKMLYQIPTFYDFVFPIFPEFRHKAEEAEDSRATAKEVWQQPRKIIEIAIHRLKQRYSNAQMIIVKDIFGIEDTVLKDDVMATLHWIAERFDKLIISIEKSVTDAPDIFGETFETEEELLEKARAHYDELQLKVNSTNDYAFRNFCILIFRAMTPKNASWFTLSDMGNRDKKLLGIARTLAEYPAATPRNEKKVVLLPSKDK